MLKKMQEGVTAPVSGRIDLKSKIAIVTGAARGIGRATCLALAQEGADIAAVDIVNPDETVANIKRIGRKAVEVICDIGNPEDVQAMVEEVAQNFGQVNILVNNAGILGYSKKSFEEYTPEEWDDLLRVNLRGPALVTQAAWPYMVRQGGGKIVCLGSIAGRIGGLLVGPHYSASKGGLHAFVKCAARRGGPLGIYVNGIAPGPIETPMIDNVGFTSEGIPLGRLGRPEDVAMAVVFLASQASNFVTGHILDVNGGLLML
jgi:3-oxoacyl-[acyl-carrier protein] reductase